MAQPHPPEVTLIGGGEVYINGPFEKTVAEDGSVTLDIEGTIIVQRAGDAGPDDPWVVIGGDDSSEIMGRQYIAVEGNLSELLRNGTFEDLFTRGILTAGPQENLRNILEGFGDVKQAEEHLITVNLNIQRLTDMKAPLSTITTSMFGMGYDDPLVTVSADMTQMRAWLEKTIADMQAVFPVVQRNIQNAILEAAALERLQQWLQ